MSSDPSSEAVDPSWRDRLRRNLESVRERMFDAAHRSGRSPDDVRLCAVTKSVTAEVVDELLACGIAAVGENRSEVIRRKQDAIGRPVPWHMIGHYQRKKVARTAPLLRMVHSVHDLRLMDTLERRMAEDGTPLPILVQVNVSGETSKQGFRLDEAEHAADLADVMHHLTFRGFMTMAPWDAPEGELRDTFGAMRDVAEAVGRDRAVELSMGMSDDFEIAIEEGATLVRVGRALYEGLSDELLVAK